MRSPFFATALIFCSLAFATSALAQDPPPDLETGQKPFGSFVGADIDTVSLSQGGLSVHIPLLAYPQRGAPRLDFNIFYFNYTFGYAAHCLKDGTCTDSVSFSGVRNTYVDDAQSMALESGRNCAIPHTPSRYIVPNPTVRTADGANHPIGDTGSGWSYTVDGTGIRAVPGLPTVTDQNGVTYSPTKKEDSNGNLISLSASGSSTSGWTDTLNRTIPYPPNNGYPNTVAIVKPPSNPGVSTNTSQCVGPLPVTRAALWNIPGPSGAAIPIKFCFANVTVKFSVYAPDNGTNLQQNSSWEMIQSILLPNGQSWEFEYNDSNGLAPTDPNYVNYASLTKITFPTGGTISYTWETVPSGDTTSSRRVLTRTVDAMDGTGAHAWTYTYGGTPQHGPFPFTNTVTDSLGNYRNHVFTSLYGHSVYETQAATYDKSSGTAVLLKTVNTDYQWTAPTRGLTRASTLP